MYNALLALHNLMRWVIILLLVIAIIKSFVAMTSNRPFTSGDKQLGLILMICAHITLLIGLYQWLMGRYGVISTNPPEGVEVMKNVFYRFYWIEHPVGMILAIALITIGRAQSKKNILDLAKHKRTFWYYLV